MAIFKLYECDVGFVVDGTKYEFPNVNQVVFEDNERNRLTRGASATDEIGLTYRDGIKDPKRILPDVLEMNADLYALFVSLFVNQTRFEFYCISRKDGSSKMGKNCILSNRPQQLNLDETADSLAVSLEVETFKIEEVHKS